MTSQKNVTDMFVSTYDKAIGKWSDKRVQIEPQESGIEKGTQIGIEKENGSGSKKGTQIGIEKGTQIGIERENSPIPGSSLFLIWQQNKMADSFIPK
ncbi:MAG: hypothetical protein R2825_22345 [Saprospiraceae bacterium]